jgi:hypothetical protein
MASSPQINEMMCLFGRRSRQFECVGDRRARVGENELRQMNNRSFVLVCIVMDKNEVRV